MNVVTLIGNLATEVEVREVAPDKRVASFVLAVDRASRDEVANRGEAGIGPLADEEVAAAGDGPQRSAEAARVLHSVLRSDPVVACSPEAKARAGHAIELHARIREKQRAGGLTGVGVMRGPDEESLGEGGVERVRIGHAPPAE